MYGYGRFEGELPLVLACQTVQLGEVRFSLRGLPYLCANVGVKECGELDFPEALFQTISKNYFTAFCD